MQVNTHDRTGQVTASKGQVTESKGGVMKSDGSLQSDFRRYTHDKERDKHKYKVTKDGRTKGQA